MSVRSGSDILSISWESISLTSSVFVAACAKAVGDNKSYSSKSFSDSSALDSETELESESKISSVFPFRLEGLALSTVVSSSLVIRS